MCACLRGCDMAQVDLLLNQGMVLCKLCQQAVLQAGKSGCPRYARSQSRYRKKTIISAVHPIPSCSGYWRMWVRMRSFASPKACWTRDTASSRVAAAVSEKTSRAVSEKIRLAISPAAAPPHAIGHETKAEIRLDKKCVFII